VVKNPIVKSEGPEKKRGEVTSRSPPSCEGRKEGKINTGKLSIRETDPNHITQVRKACSAAGTRRKRGLRGKNRQREKCGIKGRDILNTEERE